MIHVWTVLCRAASVDNQSNTVSLLSVLEEVQVPPGALGQVVAIEFEVVSLFQRTDLATPETTEAQLIFEDPLGTEVGSFPLAIDLSRHARLRTRVASKALRISDEGTFWFKVRDANGETLAQVPFTVKVVDSTEEE